MELIRVLNEKCDKRLFYSRLYPHLAVRKSFHNAIYFFTVVPSCGCQVDCTISSNRKKTKHNLHEHIYAPFPTLSSFLDKAGHLTSVTLKGAFSLWLCFCSGKQFSSSSFPSLYKSSKTHLRATLSNHQLSPSGQYRICQPKR